MPQAGHVLTFLTYIIDLHVLSPPLTAGTGSPAMEPILLYPSMYLNFSGERLELRLRMSEVAGSAHSVERERQLERRRCI